MTYLLTVLSTIGVLAVLVWLAVRLGYVTTTEPTVIVFEAEEQPHGSCCPECGTWTDCGCGQ